MKLQSSSALRLSALRGFAASLAVALLVANVARADINWVLQPTSTLSFTGQAGYATDANNVLNISELYNLVTETDNGTGLFPGFTNGLVTYSAGTMTSIGNNFLSSLNFGAEPTVPTIDTAQTVTQNNGNWYPDLSTANAPFTWGDAPLPQNVAARLSRSATSPTNKMASRWIRTRG